jgi:hypothetical protein
MYFTYFIVVIVITYIISTTQSVPDKIIMIL